MFTLPTALTLALCLFPQAPVGASTDQDRAEPSVTQSPEAEAPADRDLEAFRRSLLERAFEIARRYPKRPHLKNQARILEQVVRAALELEQPRLALSMVPANGNWRRGAGYADYAYYCAENGFDAQVEPNIALALEIANNGDLTSGQTWRRDRIRSRVAQCYVVLGEMQRAIAIEAELDPSERGRSQMLAASLAAGEDFDEFVKLLEATMSVGDFDQMKNMLEALPGVVRRQAAHSDRVEALLRVVEESEIWPKLPVSLRVEAWSAAAVAVAEVGATERAREMLGAARGLIDEREQWPAEPLVPLLAAIAQGLAAAGDQAAAEASLAEALGAYEAGRERITDVFRAEALRPVAEAYWRIGRRETALAVYARVLEEGATNPNSWPRGDDLIETMLSMARLGIDPGQELNERIDQLAADVFTD